MVRLVNILKKQEKERTFFNQEKTLPQEKESAREPGTQTSQGLYKELLGIIRQVLSDILNAKPFDLKEAREKMDLLIDLVSRDDPSLLRLIEKYDDSEDYLVVHSVNVCVLSLEIARGLNYDKGQMRDLGIGALLLDIGMVKTKNILENKRRLYYAEYEEIKNHTNYGLEILKNVDGMNDRILAIIAQHHERSDGSGYLNRLSGDQIDEYAKIVGLADVYEALVHSRPHRNKLIPFEYETIREIVSNRNMFDPFILRVFLERLTKHPAYMLWLATNGIYEILKLQDKMSQGKEARPEIKPEVKPGLKNKYLVLAASLVVFLLGATMFLWKTNINSADRTAFYPLGSSVGIAENKLPLKIAYNFKGNVAEATVASLDLGGINLSEFYYLSFSSRVENKSPGRLRFASLKVTVTNARKETASYYVQDLSSRWKVFRLPLSYFDTIKDWSAVANLSFIIQPWNIEGKEGNIYIDDIYFFRKK